MTEVSARLNFTDLHQVTNATGDEVVPLWDLHGETDLVWGDDLDASYVEQATHWTGPGLDPTTIATQSWTAATRDTLDYDTDTLTPTVATLHLRYRTAVYERPGSAGVDRSFYLTAGNYSWYVPMTKDGLINTVDYDLLAAPDAFGDDLARYLPFIITGSDSDAGLLIVQDQQLDNGQITQATDYGVRIYELWLDVTVADQAAAVVVPYTRLHPRDDGRGMSAAPRIYPPPRSQRIAGGYQ